MLTAIERNLHSTARLLRRQIFHLPDKDLLHCFQNRFLLVPGHRTVHTPLERFSSDVDDSERNVPVFTSRSVDVSLPPQNSFVTVRASGSFASLAAAYWAGHPAPPEPPLNVNSDLDGKFNPCLVATLRRLQVHERLSRNAELMSKYCRDGDAEGALSSFERTLTEDRVIPPRYLVFGLIRLLADRGHSQSAFSVYHKMLEIGMRPSPYTYSQLFRACAKDSHVWYRSHEYLFPALSDYPDQFLSFHRRALLEQTLSSSQLLEEFGGPALACAQSLWEKLIAKPFPRDPIPYNSVISALGKAGDLHGCLVALDHMMMSAVSNSKQRVNVAPDAYTLSAVLAAVRPAAIKRKLSSIVNGNSWDTGTQMDEFELALNLWHRIVPHIHGKLSPHNFNSFVNAIKEANTGDPVRPIVLSPNLQDSTTTATVFSDKSRSIPSDSVGPDIVRLDWNNLELSLHSPINLLTPPKRCLTVVPPADGWLSWHRLALLGGFHGFLDSVEKHFQVTVDVYILTSLVDVLPFLSHIKLSEEEFDTWETALFQYAQDHKLTLNMGLYNALINRRSVTGLDARPVLKKAVASGFVPNQVTWNSLCKSCKTITSIRNLLRSMAEAGTRDYSSSGTTNRSSSKRPPPIFFTSLLKASRFNWNAKAYILRLMSGEEPDLNPPGMHEKDRLCLGWGLIPPDRRTIATLEIDIALFREILAKGVIPVDGSYLPPGPSTGGIGIPADAEISFYRFLPTYRKWLRETGTTAAKELNTNASFNDFSNDA
ncbi:unnamed protein product [Calicophoron daubneyi]|uniref:Pentatricopeptide repeat-containing protein n=1 Tax=Calicophoron daubneyi TaxID=300641 RepID=A0AAV2TAN6_CALDB